jgi:hypothetical protein
MTNVIGCACVMFDQSGRKKLPLILGLGDRRLLADDM